MRSPISWFEIYVEDMPRAVAFYQSVLGVELSLLREELEAGFAMYGFPSDGPDSGALVWAKGYPVGNNSTVVYFDCEDCAVEAARVEQAGGTLQRDKMAIGEHGFVALARDTEGNLFGLRSMK